jgi:hypothetical protein
VHKDSTTHTAKVLKYQVCFIPIINSVCEYLLCSNIILYLAFIKFCPRISKWHKFFPVDEYACLNKVRLKPVSKG